MEPAQNSTHNEQQPPVIEWIISKQNTRIPKIGMFTFNSIGGYKDVAYWLCMHTNCNAILHTRAEVFKCFKGEHEHTGKRSLEYELTFKKDIADLVDKHPFNSAKRIYDSALLNMNQSLLKNDDREEILTNLPSFENIRSSIYAKKHKIYPALQSSRLTTAVDPSLCKTQENRNFIFINSMAEHDDIVFADITFIEKLDLANLSIHMDGTFKSCPNNFYQLFVIHVIQKNHSFPVFYCFLHDKSSITYRRILCNIVDKLRDLNIAFIPKKIMIDFEYASFNAIRHTWSGQQYEIKGCYFHFGQCIWRKVNALGFRELYNEDKAFVDLVNLCMALPLVPTEKLSAAWGIITSKAMEVEEDILLFTDYVLTMWLENGNRALFHRDIWNHFESTGSRTNNVAEAFNSKLNRLLNKTHPNFYEVVDVLSKIQFEMNIQFMRLEAGFQPLRKKKKYVDAELRINNLKRDLRQNEEIDLETLEKYMKKASNAIKFIIE